MTHHPPRRGHLIDTIRTQQAARARREARINLAVELMAYAAFAGLFMWMLSIWGAR